MGAGYLHKGFWEWGACYPLNDWSLYRELMRLGLRFCESPEGFRRLMVEQADNAKACKEEAPEVAMEIRAMCEEARELLSNASAPRFGGH